MQNIYSCTTAAQKANSLPATKNFSASQGYQIEISKSVMLLSIVTKFLSGIFSSRYMKQDAKSIDVFSEKIVYNSNSVTIGNLYDEKL